MEYIIGFFSPLQYKQLLGDCHPITSPDTHFPIFGSNLLSLKIDMMLVGTVTLVYCFIHYHNPIEYKAFSWKEK
jgi:hypothetical protein